MGHEEEFEYTCEKLKSQRKRRGDWHQTLFENILREIFKNCQKAVIHRLGLSKEEVRKRRRERREEEEEQKEERKWEKR